MHSRNAGLQRLRTLTKRVGVVTVVLTGVFAGLAAASNSGKHQRRTGALPRTPLPATPTSRTTSIPAPPSLPPLRSGDDGSSAPAPSSSPAPAAPSQAPVQTEAPPVVVSGGS